MGAKKMKEPSWSELRPTNDAETRASFERRARDGEQDMLPIGIIEDLRISKPVMDYERRGNGRHSGLYHDSKYLALCARGFYPGDDLSFWWIIEGTNDGLDHDEFTISQARDVSKNIEARNYIDWFEESGSEEYQEWFNERDSIVANALDLKAMKFPPWVMTAKEDLEASSAMFAIEFAERLYPRLINCKSTSDQLAAIRESFVETVEAA